MNYNVRNLTIDPTYTYYQTEWKQKKERVANPIIKQTKTLNNLKSIKIAEKMEFKEAESAVPKKVVRIKIKQNTRETFIVDKDSRTNHKQQMVGDDITQLINATTIAIKKSKLEDFIQDQNLIDEKLDPQGQLKLMGEKMKELFILSQMTEKIYTEISNDFKFHEKEIPNPPVSETSQLLTLSISTQKDYEVSPFSSSLKSSELSPFLSTPNFGLSPFLSTPKDSELSLSISTPKSHGLSPFLSTPKSPWNYFLQ